MLKYLLTAILLSVSVLASGAANGAEPETPKELDFEEAYTSIIIDCRVHTDAETITLNHLRALKWFMANKDKDPRCTDDVLADVAIALHGYDVSQVDCEFQDSVTEVCDLANKLLFSIHNLRVNVYLVQFMYGWNADGMPPFYDFSCHDELVRRIKKALPQDIEDFKTIITHYPKWFFVHEYLETPNQYYQYNSIYLLWLFYKYNRKEYVEIKRLFEKYCVLFENDWDNLMIDENISYNVLMFPENRIQGLAELDKYDEMEGKEGWEKNTSIAETKKWFKSFKVTKLNNSKDKLIRKLFIKYIKDTKSKNNLISCNALYNIEMILQGLSSVVFDSLDRDNSKPYVEKLSNVMKENLQSKNIEKKYAVLALIHKLCKHNPSEEQFNLRQLIINVIDVLAGELAKCKDEKVCEALVFALSEVYNTIFDYKDYDAEIEIKIQTHMKSALKHKFMRIRYMAAVFIYVIEDEPICFFNDIQFCSINRSNLKRPAFEVSAFKESGNIMAQLRAMLKMDDTKWNYFAMRLLGLAVRYNKDEFEGKIKSDVAFSDETWALIVRQLHNEDRGVRYWAVAAIAEAGRRQLTGELITILNDKDSHIKEMALGGLQSISGKKFGHDRAKWRAWWEANKSRILKEEAEKEKQAENK